MTGFPYPIKPGQAAAIQEALRPVRILEDAFPPVRHIAGVDVAYEKGSDRACCVIAVHSYPDLEERTFSEAHGEASFPYISGLLAFREGPLIEKAFAGLGIVPEILLFDGSGICHPRGVGLATHMGIVLGCASIGVSKTPFVGLTSEPAQARGSVSPIMSGDLVVGASVRTRQGVQPVYVSQGHRVSLDTAVGITLGCARRYRIPEPLRSAHIRAGQGLHRAAQ